MQALLSWNLLMQRNEKGWGGMSTLSLTNGACVRACVCVCERKAVRDTERLRDRGGDTEEKREADREREMTGL